MAAADGLPDFLVIGAMKAGTTALHAHLAAHPALGLPRLKETDFFVPELSGRRDLGWYRAQFPPAALRGEVSPNYAKALVFPGVPARIAAVLPQVRLVYLLRDPVARGLSEYRHKCAAGLLRPGAPVAPEAFERLADPGLYHRQIVPYLAHLRPERILCLTSEALAARPREVLSQLAGFLGIEDDWPQPAGHDNSAIVRLPAWYWRLRGTAAARALRRALPPAAAAGLRRAAMQPAREIALPDGLAGRLLERSRKDAEALRGLTGLATPGWSC